MLQNEIGLLAQYLLFENGPCRIHTSPSQVGELFPKEVDSEAHKETCSEEQGDNRGWHHTQEGVHPKAGIG